MGESDQQGVDTLPAAEEIVVTSDAPPAASAAPPASTTPDPEGKPAQASAKPDPEATPAKQDTEGEGEGEDKDKPAPSGQDAAAAKRGDSAKKRIDTLTAKLRDAERRGAYERGRREELERQLAQRVHSATPADPDPRPKLDDFETADEYAESLADWKVRQLDAGKAGEATHGSGKTKASTDKPADGSANLHPISKSYAAAKERHDDLDDVISDPTRPFTAVMADAVADDPNGLEVLYRLGQDIDELIRVSQLPSHQQRRHVLRLAEAVEAELSAAEARPAKSAEAGAKAPDLNKVPAAPAAPQPPSGRAVADADLASLSDGEYIERREAEEAETRRRRG